jgi:hypothetical protein
MTLQEIYLDLIILQYSDKPKARATIEALLKDKLLTAEQVLEFNNAFDLDQAVGILGRIIGLSRTVPDVVPKIYFGFDDNTNSRTFNSAPMLDSTQSIYTDLELNDSDYRKFLKAKISKNFSSNTLSSDEKVSTNEALNFLFDGQAYAIDNKNMTMTVLVEDTFDTEGLSSINALDLVPRPATVDISYKTIGDNTFGFADNPNASTFNSGIMAQYINV